MLSRVYRSKLAIQQIVRHARLRLRSRRSTHVNQLTQICGRTVSSLPDSPSTIIPATPLTSPHPTPEIPASSSLSSSYLYDSTGIAPPFGHQGDIDATPKAITGPLYPGTRQESGLGEFNHDDNDGSTIFQLSSGLGNFGEAVGLAVVRISGTQALPLLMEISTLKKPPTPRMATFCSIIDPRTLPQRQYDKSIQRDKISENQVDNSDSIPPAPPISRLASLDYGILVTYFRGPNSFTGEDVVELHLHGNNIIVQRVLSVLSSLNGQTPTRWPYVPRQSHSPNLVQGSYESESPTMLGRSFQQFNVRLADRGEFTRRSFLAGKMDLTQVEGLADLLKARTAEQHSLAMRQFQGHLGKLYQSWRKEMVECLAYCEVVIDFAEDEADIAEKEIMNNVMPRVVTLVKRLRAHLADGRRGEIVRRGVRMAIVGAPNAGKSTLTNALSYRDVSIVSNIPGTTRDIVETTIDVSGYPVVLADTAGLRQSADVVENEGVRRAIERVKEADVKVVMVDGERFKQAIVSAFSIGDQSQSGSPDSNTSSYLAAAGDIWRGKYGNITLPESPIDQLSAQHVNANTIIVVSKVDTLPGVVFTQAVNRVRNKSAIPIFHTKNKEILEAEAMKEKVDEAYERETGIKRGGSSGGIGGRTIEKVDWEESLISALKKSYPSVGGVCIISVEAEWNMDKLLTLIRDVIEKRLGIGHGQELAERAVHVKAARLDITENVDSSRNCSSKMELLDDMPITNTRQRAHLEECLSHLEAFLPPPGKHIPQDLVLAAENMRLAVRALGKIVGSVHVEELLDVIFNDFCIGK